MPWPNYTYVAFDTETTGKYPLVAEIVELAAVKWSRGAIVDTFQALVKPSELMNEAVIRIHHITNEMVQAAPPLSEVLPRFHGFLEDSVCIAHNAAFDLGFLALEFEKFNLPLPISAVLDSCQLGQRAFPNMINHRLATLASLLNINVGSAHRALDDSRTCLQVAFQSMKVIGSKSTLDFIFQAQGGPLLWPRYSMNALKASPTHGVLVEACSSQLAIEVVYTGGVQPGVPRRMTAQGLVRNHQGDYLIGLCHRENHQKRFYLSRILSARILD